MDLVWQAATLYCFWPDGHGWFSLNQRNPDKLGAIAISSYTRILGLVILFAMSHPSLAQDKPNILVIWGDDIGKSNISYFTNGVMGYRTPSIDRIAREGMAFTDYYGEQSCTAGRS